jgi:hypothetical protein
MTPLRERLFQRLLPIVDRFAGDVAELIAARVELEVDREVARIDEALAVALSGIADGTKETIDVEDEKPARDRKVARAKVSKPRRRRVARRARASADRGDGAPAVPAAVASAPSSPTPREAPIAEAVKKPRACSKCGEPGRAPTRAASPERG